jgi:hypothetical protein
MAIGSSGTEVFLRMPIEDAFARAEWAGADAGKVLESNPTTSSLVVRTNYGLQRVKLRVTLHPAEGGTTVKIGGASDDVWGAGARKGSDKYVAALNRVG